jgi:subtilisin-like proprotein convertase family protein
MKQILTLVMAMATGAAAFGQQVFSTNVNSVIPDNNPGGLASQIAVGGLSGAISNVTVNLDITGGYNGDLYAYVAGPNGGFAVLLNRTGASSTSAYGYGDSGFNVTFDDSAAAANPDIHFYQTVSNPNGGLSGGVLTGNWGSDGETFNPQLQSSYPVAPTATPTATLGSFDGADGNGQWTLFLADLSGGDQSTVVSWSLDITTVPEPEVWALGAMGVLLLALRNKIAQRK